MDEWIDGYFIILLITTVEKRASTQKLRASTAKRCTLALKQRVLPQKTCLADAGETIFCSVFACNNFSDLLWMFILLGKS